jgi:hypothetical protein
MIGSNLLKILFNPFGKSNLVHACMFAYALSQINHSVQRNWTLKDFSREEQGYVSIPLIVAQSQGAAAR